MNSFPLMLRPVLINHFSPRFIDYVKFPLRSVASVSVQPADGTDEIKKTGRKKEVKSSFAKNLFVGKFDVEVLTFPEALDHEQLRTLNDIILPIDQYLNNIDSKSIDASACIPEETISQLKVLGLFGQQIPKEYGGLGLNSTECARVSEVTSRDGSISAMLTAHQSMGLKGILLSGSDKQKHHYLPHLASGEWVSAFCLTEKDCGSDATMIETRAKLVDNVWHLTGNKTWISNGNIADLFTVIAKTEIEDNAGKMQDTLTAFLVERGFNGVSIGEGEDKLGLRGLVTCEVNFENTPVPVENVLGEAGNGFKIAMDILHSDRFLTGSYAAGVLKRFIDVTTDQVINRKQFGRQLKDFELIQKKLAKITCLTYAIESMTYLTAGIFDNYEYSDGSLESAIVKVFSSENLWQCVGECQQIFGGLGLLKKHPYEQILRDSRFPLVFQGSNDVLRIFIALSGLQHAGVVIKDTVEKLRNPLMNPRFIFSKFLEKRGHVKNNPKLTLGLDGYVHPSLQTSAKQLEYSVLRLEYIVELVLSRYGLEVVEHQMELQRIANIVISIYAMTAVIGRASRSYCIGLQDSDYEMLVAAAFCLEALESVNANVKNIEDGPFSSNDINYKKIAQKVFKNKGYFAMHPLERNF